MARRRFKLINAGSLGGGEVSSALADLSDVSSATPTERFALMADGTEWSGRLLVEADISDLGNYASIGHDHLVADISDFIDNSANWDTAFGWGDHAAEGYLTSLSEADPTVPAWVKAITSAEVTFWNTAYGWGDHNTEDYARKPVDETITGNWTFTMPLLVQNDVTIQGELEVFEGVRTASTLNVADVAAFEDDVFVNGTLSVFGSDIDLANDLGINWLGGGEMIHFSSVAGGDPDWASVVLHADFDGPDEATSFTTEDPDSRTVTFFGTAKIDTTRSKHGGASLLLDGNSDYVSIPSTTNLSLNTVDDLTIEWWMYKDTVITTPGKLIFTKGGIFGSVWPNYSAVINATTETIKFNIAENGSVLGTLDSTTAVPLNTWMHCAVTWDASTQEGKLWVDGVLEDTTTIVGTPYSGNTEDFIIGHQPSGTGDYFTGNIEDFRITRGVIRYTDTFSPPGALPTSAAGDGSVLTLGDPGFGTVIDGTNTTINSTLNVTGAVTANSTLDVTGAITALSYGGVLEANLLDKTAAETITSAWTFSNSLTADEKINVGVTTVTTTTHTAAAEHVILVDDDTAAATVTVTLPAAATANTIYHVKKLGTTAPVIIDGNTAETIDGGLTITLNAQYESVMLVSNGTNWSII